MGKHRTGRDTLGAKSTLEGNHRFPTFYACYILKSIRTPKSSATYIGSTPSPPRRLRQHNGELTAGAWKTSRNRPWEMQMIVHGFPSKLAALQFEWAWQHPYLSRYVRDALVKPSEPSVPVPFGTKGPKLTTLKANIKAVRVMLSTHPYTTWPLHVKLFTDEAVKHWNAVNEVKTLDRKAKGKKTAISFSDVTAGLPLGSTVSIELEGVDGKAPALARDIPGRTGPIEVTDAHFTLSHLAKFSSLLSSTSSLRCEICTEELSFRHPIAPEDHLAISLCPNSECHGLMHVACLSQHFLEEERDQSSPGTGTSQLIPRGGHCPSCKSYTLWGDVIRGCYRRFIGAKSGVEATVQEEEDAGIEVESDGDPVLSMNSDTPPVKANKEKAKVRTSPKRPSPRRKTKNDSPSKSKKAGPSKLKRRASSSDSGEVFDMDVISSDSDAPVRGASPAIKRTRGRPRLVDAPRKLKTSSRAMHSHVGGLDESGSPSTPVSTRRSGSNKDHETGSRKIHGISGPIRFNQAVDLDDLPDSSFDDDDIDWVRDTIRLKRATSPVAIHGHLVRSLSSLSLSSDCDGNRGVGEDKDGDVLVISD